MKLYYETKEGELEHGLFGTTKPRANTKYIEKIQMPNGKYRYFYTQAELDAYNAMRKLSKGAANMAGKVKAGVGKAIANTKDGVMGTTNPKAGKQYVDKVKMPNGQIRYFNTEEEKAAYAKAMRASKKVGETARAVKEGVLDLAGKRYYDEAEGHLEARKAAEKKRNKALTDSATYKRERDRYAKEAEKGTTVSAKAYGKNKKAKEAELKKKKAEAEKNARVANVKANKAKRDHEEYTREYMDANEKYNQTKAKGDKSLYGLIQNIKKKKKKKTKVVNSLK